MKDITQHNTPFNYTQRTSYCAMLRRVTTYSKMVCVRNLCTKEASPALPCVFEPLQTRTHYRNGGPGGGRNSFAGYSYTITCTECKHVFRDVSKSGGEGFLKAGTGYVKKEEYETNCPTLALRR